MSKFKCGLWATILVLVLVTVGLFPSIAEELEPDTLVVHFIDVGQGDATLFVGPDFTILIDAGRHDRDDVVPYLQSVGVDTIDLLIGTHPHADHIGQFPQVLHTFPVGEVWMSGDPHTTLTFERAIDAILASDADYHEPRAGEVYTFGDAEITVLNPDQLTGDFHEGSVSVRVVYGDIAFVLTGDAEEHTERAMIQRGHELQARVLQLGHHGSHTSSSLAFLQAIQPEIAIYSAAQDNQYGHPHAVVIERLEGLGIPVYGTDQHGTIRIITDGETYQVETEIEDEQESLDQPVEIVVPTGDDDGCQPGQVDINSAPVEELVRIQHIGEQRAAALIQLRPFASVDDLVRISGIAAGRLADIKEQGLACVR